MLLLFYGLISSLRYWARFKLLPLYLIASAALLWQQSVIDWTLLGHVASDFIPTPLQQDNVAAELLPWLTQLFTEQILPGVGNTLLVTQMALALTGLLALALFPIISAQFTPLPARLAGHGLLVVLRSTPELIIAFACLLLWGPSMLPAVVALAIHNGAIVGHLLGCHSNEVPLRIDSPRGMNRYGFEILPRIYGQFLAFLCYRWEVIMRESAILGILGIHTLGFYIDSAFESFRLDVAALLILVTACMNIGVDQLSRWLRHRLHLQNSPVARTPC